MSVRYSLISRETSFVAVERRVTPVIGDTQLRRVPIALTSGWGGVEQRPRLGRAMVFGGGKPLQDIMDTHSLMEPRRSIHVEARGTLPPQRSARVIGASVMGRLFSRKNKESADVLSSPTGLHALVALQQADGHWDLTAELANVLQRDLTEITRALRGASGNQGDTGRVWATALAIAWLELRAPDDEEQWRLLRAKAQRWIDNLAVDAPAGATWSEAARTFLRS